MKIIPTKKKNPLHYQTTGNGVSTEIRTDVKIFFIYSTTIRKQEKDQKDLGENTNWKK